MLTVEIRDAVKAANGEAEIEIFCDASGLSLLRKELDRLEANGGHLHLMSDQWGGHELEGIALGDGNQIAHHLKITLTPPIRP